MRRDVPNAAARTRTPRTGAGGSTLALSIPAKPTSYRREILQSETAGESITFEVPGKPVSKARPRHGRTSSGKPVTYTPRKTVEDEQRIAWFFRQAAKGWRPQRDAEYSVECLFLDSTNQRRDVDNMVKAVLDALNGLAWVDDTQVIDITASKRRSEKGAERSIVSITHQGVRQGLRAACSVCRKTYPIPPSKRDVTPYCSKECRDCARRVAVECAVCAKGFTIARTHARKTRNVCSSCKIPSAEEPARD